MSKEEKEIIKSIIYSVAGVIDAMRYTACNDGEEAELKLRQATKTLEEATELLLKLKD